MLHLMLVPVLNLTLLTAITGPDIVFFSASGAFLHLHRNLSAGSTYVHDFPPGS